MGQLGTAAVLPLLGYFAELYNIQTAIQLSILASLIIPIMLLFIKEKK
jgi:hypothetical protein